MTRLLPPTPSVRFLQEQAKDALKAQRRGDRSVCGALRLLRRFHAVADDDILAADVALHEMQFALAMDYGFSSWPAMRAYVEAETQSADAGEARLEGDGVTRHVLNGVPKVSFFSGKLCPFPACMESICEFLGRPEPYDYLMGVSGAAFRRVWHPADGGNVDLGYFFPEPHRLLFQAIGLTFRALPRDDRTVLLAEMKASIAAGRPVIAFGIVGPPEAEIVAGYDRGGDVLLGHSFFDFDRRPEDRPYFECEKWHEHMIGMHPTDGEAVALGAIVLGPACPRPSARQTLRTSLEWAVDLARVSRRSRMRKHVCGLAAYDAWADWLDVDARFAADQATPAEELDGEFTPRSTLEMCAMLHGDQCTMLWERQAAASFLQKTVSAAGSAADVLTEAADLYEQISKANVWPWHAKHYMADEVKQGLMDSDLRRSFAAEIRRARQLEADAVDKLAAALDLLGDGEG